MIQKTIESFIADESLFGPKDSVLLSISGGPDSVFLCHFLNGYLESGNLSLIYFDHGLRSDEARVEEATTVSTLADTLKLPLIAECLDVKAFSKTNRCSIETAGRKLRYASLQATAKKTKRQVIATAHHLDDWCETVMHQLLRGTKCGLGGIKPKRIDGDGCLVVRPLLCIDKAQILDWLRDENISYVTDASNCDTAFTRNKIRHDLMPKMADINPTYKEKLWGFVSYQNEQQRFITTQLKPFLDKVCLEEGSVMIRKSHCDGLDPLLHASFVLEMFKSLAGQAHGLSELHVLELKRLLSSRESLELHLPGRYRAYATREVLRIVLI